MAGTIRTLEKCPSCGGKFQSEPLRCPRCKTVPTRYFIDFGWKGNRIRIFTDKEGHAFSSWEATDRFLTVMRAKVDEKNFDLREYVKVEVRGLRFANYAQTWLARRELEVERGHLSRGYFRSVKIYIRRFLVPFFEKRSIRDIHEGLIEDFRDQLPVNLKPKTVYNIMAILRKMMADAHRRRDINRLPQFPTITVPDPETKWIGKKEQQAILAHVKDPVCRTLLLLMMETGCRPGEARAVKWGRVQFRANKVIFAAGMDCNISKERTKEGDVRIIPMAPELREAMLQLPRGDDEDFVFLHQGKPFKDEVVRRTWREAARKAGIKVNCYQGTRHSIASQAINSGIPLEVIGKMLGHKSRSSTTRYAHLNPEALNQMLRRESELAMEGPATAVERQQGEKSPGKVLKFKKVKN